MTVNTLANPEYPNPSREDYCDFLVRIYFGAGDDLLLLCVRRAYHDMNRTLRGLRRIRGAEALRERATDCVATLLKDLPAKKIDSADAFDRWHKARCGRLISVYPQAFSLSVGQAQKWLNMALKYIFTLGEGRIPGYAPLYKFAHIPIDSIVLKEVARLGGPKLTMPWSRLNDYGTYIAYQQECRNLFSGSCPLAAEFRLFQDNAAER